MAGTHYDKYYKTVNLFGTPYPELITFFEAQPNKGKLLGLAVDKVVMRYRWHD